MNNKKVLANITEEEAEKFLNLDAEKKTIFEMQNSLISKMSNVNSRIKKSMREIALKYEIDPDVTWMLVVDKLEIIEGHGEG